ncbi:MAG: carbohydrate-binding domain-containing protein [Alloprevotella sp.]
MKHASLSLLLVLFLSLAAAADAAAQNVVRIHRQDGVVLLTDILSTDSLDFNADESVLRLHLGNTVGEVAVEEIDSITFGPAVSGISVAYSADGVSVMNPYAFRGLDITVAEGNCVTVTSLLSEELTYTLSGSGSGAFKLYSPKKQILVLDNLSLTSANGPAINIQSKKKTEVRLPEGTSSELCDAATYVLSDTEDMKGCFFSEGQLVFTGGGELTVSGRYKHAVCSDDYVEIENGTLIISQAVSDGIHCKDSFTMSGGNVRIAGTGDGIDCEGFLTISGGTLDVTLEQTDTKAVKADSALTVSGGTLTVSLKGDQTKGLKSGGPLTVKGGSLTFNCSGNVVVTDGDPSYCTALKSDSTLCVEGGEIGITHSGTAGKGLSSDGTFTISGGKVTATLTGAGGTYTNASNASDTYNSTAMKADAALLIEGGELELSLSGTGGKGISCDGLLTIGGDTEGPVIRATTTGSKIGGTTGGWSTAFGPGGGGGGWPGGGPGGTTSSSGGNPKAIRCEGDILVRNGSLILSTSQDGGEGIESKQTLTIDGGTIEATTYDDALNAAKAIVVNGGNVYAYASNNDGIDSNGTITINGGTLVASGASSPEEGFDCDQNTFLINGGLMVGVGGATSTPSSQSAQCSAVYSAGSASSGTVYTVTASDGSQVFSFAVPRTYSSMTMLFSSPLLTQSSTFLIKTDCSVSGGTTFHGLTSGAEVSGGTQKTSFTTSSKVTTVR